MTDQNNLTRFLEAQVHDYESALQEVKRGKKTGHWMWYIFPQINGLGNSETARFFSISDKVEATQYLDHPVLGARLLEITSELLNLDLNNPITIFGSIDSLKLKSSMTLFSLVEPINPIFQKVLDKFFDGKKDINTIQIVNS